MIDDMWEVSDILDLVSGMRRPVRWTLRARLLYRWVIIPSCLLSCPVCGCLTASFAYSLAICRPACS